MYHIFRKLSSDFGDRCGQIVYIESYSDLGHAKRMDDYMRGFYAKHGLAISHIILVQLGHTLQPIS